MESLMITLVVCVAIPTFVAFYMSSDNNKKMDNMYKELYNRQQEILEKIDILEGTTNYLEQVEYSTQKHVIALERGEPAPGKDVLKDFKFLWADRDKSIVARDRLR
jgi:hypothetical protein